MLTIDENLCAPGGSEGSATAAALNEFTMSLLAGDHVNLSIARHFRIPTAKTFVVVAAGFSANPGAAAAEREAVVPRCG
ncbi:hypothetical protein [Nocardia cyriacigeorgica]|uniref:hypothetical protein n=1 Tax=Nocardia cyriacigeorgica TaxID=135487 RepID=UPI001893D7B8|nr:hypothetical protein [Nocardia cyriacigeorgica]MBF6415068.1 hypothetical protein [Nocardia cyriacigeorgica]